MAILKATTINGNLSISGPDFKFAGDDCPSCIVSSTSDANSTYNWQTWSDGTLEQWGSIPNTDGAGINGWSAWAAAGGGYYSAKSFNLLYPFAEFENYSVTACGDIGSSLGEIVRAYRLTRRSFGIEINISATTASLWNTISWRAIGRWK